MFAPWKESYDKPISVLKTRDITLPTDSYSQSYDFSSSHVWMWELDHKEGWELKNWCFWTIVLEKTLESPWTARKSNQSILKEISPEHSLEGLMLKLKLQYFGHLMQRTDSLEKTMMLRKIEGRRRRGWQRLTWLDVITDSWTWVEQAPGFDDGQGSLACCSPWGCKELDMTERLNWTDTWVQSSVLPLNCLGKLVKLLIFLNWSFFSYKIEIKLMSTSWDSCDDCMKWWKKCQAHGEHVVGKRVSYFPLFLQY